jgi:hypothetical protein
VVALILKKPAQSEDGLENLLQDNQQQDLSSFL